MASMTWSVGFSSRVNCGVERSGRCGGAGEGVAEVSAKKIFSLLLSKLLIEIPCACAQPVNRTWCKVAVTLPTLWVIAHALWRHWWRW